MRSPGPAAYVARRTIEAALTTFAGLSALNSPERQAVIVFRSRKIATNDEGLIILEQVSDLDRETVATERYCPNLKNRKPDG